MTAESIAQALGGRKVGGGWTARCPSHDDREPSLSISDAHDGKVLVCCHAGCTQRDVIAALRKLGLWANNGPSESGNADCPSAKNDDDAKRKIALRTWQFTVSPDETLEKYLRSRGLVLPEPETIRSHPNLKHPSGDMWPAMVGLVTRGVDDVPLAIHRTFLARDGSGKAPVHPQKMMLGPCRGGAVRLAPAGELLMVGEGIETCLAAMQASGQPAWAALSTSGLMALDLPKDVRDVIVLADGDEAGKAAARDAALRWKREGRSVRIARPPRGFDFNDLLLGGSPSSEGGML